MSSDGSKSELFNLSVLDLPDQTELILGAKHQYVEGLLAKLPRADRITHLTQVCSSSIEKYRDINEAFLYGILAKEHVSIENFQLLHSIMQDQWEFLCLQARYFTFSKFSLLKEGPRNRLLWLVDKLAALQARGAENLFIGLLRQIKGGDHSFDNIALIERLHQVFFTHRNWFHDQNQLIPFVIYSFLRVIAEHGIDLGLKKDLSIFCAALLHDRFKECSVLGRDLVRLLQDVSKVAEFAPIWNHLANDAVASSQLFRLLKVPTPKRFGVCRLTPDMESSLIFILENVKYGSHRRYYEWYCADFLKCSDSDSLIVDIVRYLIVCHHPTNSTIASACVQRWHIITWFLRQLKTNFGSANAKLAMFYDWLFFDPSVDNIMNIEPAILITAKSASKAPQITCAMIEYLYLLRDQYLPELSGYFHKNIDRAMHEILSKRVVSNLESILLASEVPDEIKRQTKNLFPCYLGQDSISSKLTASSSNTSLSRSESNGSHESLESIFEAKERLRSLTDQIDVNFGVSGLDPRDIEDLMLSFIDTVGSTDSFVFNESVPFIVTLFSTKFYRLNSSYEGEEFDVIEIWSKALLNGLTSSKLDKQTIDQAIERLSSLTQLESSRSGNFFNIEAFLFATVEHPKTVNSVFESPLNSPTASLESNEFVAKLLKAKSEDPKAFYGRCFMTFELEFTSETTIDPFELFRIILEDCDPSELMLLKRQLCTVARCPVFDRLQSRKLELFVKDIAATVDWDGYVQIFFWDVLSLALKRLPDVAAVQSFLRNCFEILRPLLLNSDANAELCNGIISLAIQNYPLSNLAEYDSWLLLYLEEGGDICLSILCFFWRSNSRLFLQSLVQLDGGRDSIEALMANPMTGYSKILKNILLFRQFICNLEETSPAKNSLLTCLDATAALLSRKI